MKSIEELQADLKQLYAELEERKQLEEASVSNAISFEEISSKAERVKIENHPMNGRDFHEQSMYLLLLLSVAVLDDTAYEKSISFVYRIAHGMNYNGNIQELLLQAQQMNFTRIDEITRLFLNDDIRLLLLMECMMLVQSFKKEHKKAMEYVADLCILMKLKKEQIIMVSNIARAVLMQNPAEYRCDIRNEYDIFNCYLFGFLSLSAIDIKIYHLPVIDDSTENNSGLFWWKQNKALTFMNSDGSVYHYRTSDGKTKALFTIKKNHVIIYLRIDIHLTNDLVFSGKMNVDKKYTKAGDPIAVSVESTYYNLAYNWICAHAMEKYAKAGGYVEEEGCE